MQNLCKKHYKSNISGFVSHRRNHKCFHRSAVSASPTQKPVRPTASFRKKCK